MLLDCLPAVQRMRIGVGRYHAKNKVVVMTMTGSFKILNHSAIKERAERVHDPRHVFYRALLITRTYEDYKSEVGSVKVRPETTSYVVTGDMEVKYVRDRRRWIADA